VVTRRLMRPGTFRERNAIEAVGLLMCFGSFLSYFCAMVSEPVAVSVRQARPEDVGRVQAIQLAAGNAFRDIGMPAVADSPPLPAESLSGYRRAGRAWVAVDEYDDPIGFVVADVVDDRAHIEQVSVHPAHARQRIGAMLLDHVANWAAENGLTGLTLITFRGVPWNAPYYERLGFRELADTEVTPGLAARKAAEGGNLAARVCMLRELPAHDHIDATA
jgi:GNAT superfamily N-acetyltransferase